MKKVILGVILIIFVFTVNYQVFGYKLYNINDLYIEYLKLVVRSKLNPEKNEFILDCGQSFSFKSETIRG